MIDRICRCLMLALCGAGLLVGVMVLAEGQVLRGLFTVFVAVLMFAANVAALRHEDEAG